MTKKTESIIKVGGGRGFLVKTQRGPLSSVVVVTAAHCLPHLPPACAASHIEERTYANLLGPLGESPTVWAECLFVDPVADVAVLGEPDNQMLYEETNAYTALVEARPTLRLGTWPVLGRQNQRAWVLSLAGVWQPCQVNAPYSGLALTISDGRTEGGMSGSPIVLDTGRAVGVITLGTVWEDVVMRDQFGQVLLEASLPGWLLAGTSPSAPSRLRARWTKEWASQKKTLPLLTTEPVGTGVTDDDDEEAAEGITE